MRATVGLDALDASKGDRERIIILGSGWAGKLTIGSKIYLLMTKGIQATFYLNASPQSTRLWSYRLAPTSSSPLSSIRQQPAPSNFERP